MSLPPDPRVAYTAGDPVETAHRAVKHALVRECRRVIDHIALLDPERTPDAELAQLADETRAIADRLEPLPSLREKGGAVLEHDTRNRRDAGRRYLFTVP